MAQSLIVKLTSKDMERFLSKIYNLAELDPFEDCYHWTGTLTRRKVLVYKFRGHLIPVHRFSYALRHGTLDKPLQRDKKLCSNSRCVNPHHFWEIDYYAQRAGKLTLMLVGEVPSFIAPSLGMELTSCYDRLSRDEWRPPD